jgi:translation initiation factor 2B subunit (eIF-2B alpha/beta/delta family)
LQQERTLRTSTAAWINELANDRSSGAAELAVRAAELLSITPLDDLQEAAEAVKRAQPAMAAVYNAAQAAVSGRLPEFLERLQKSGDIIARRAAIHVRGKTILTHSFSSTVVRALLQSVPRKVLCTHSLPGGEGTRTANLTRGVMIADAAAYSAMAGVDTVLIGADAVTPQMIVNKVGTSLVTLAARERGIPIWVLCGSEKLISSNWKPDLAELFESTPRAWFTGVIDDA